MLNNFIYKDNYSSASNNQRVIGPGFCERFPELCQPLPNPPVQTSTAALSSTIPLDISTSMVSSTNPLTNPLTTPAPSSSFYKQTSLADEFLSSTAKSSSTADLTTSSILDTTPAPTSGAFYNSSSTQKALTTADITTSSILDTTPAPTSGAIYYNSSTVEALTTQANSNIETTNIDNLVKNTSVSQISSSPFNYADISTFISQTGTNKWGSIIDTSSATSSAFDKQKTLANEFLSNTTSTTPAFTSSIPESKYSNSPQSMTTSLPSYGFGDQGSIVGEVLPVNNTKLTNISSNFLNIGTTPSNIQPDPISYRPPAIISDQSRAASGRGLNAGEIAGITIGSFFGFVAFCCVTPYFAYKFYKKRQENNRDAANIDAANTPDQDAELNSIGSDVNSRSPLMSPDNNNENNNENGTATNGVADGAASPENNGATSPENVRIEITQSNEADNQPQATPRNSKDSTSSDKTEKTEPPIKPESNDDSPRSSTEKSILPEEPGCQNDISFDASLSSVEGKSDNSIKNESTLLGISEVDETKFSINSIDGAEDDHKNKDSEAITGSLTFGNQGNEPPKAKGRDEIESKIYGNTTPRPPLNETTVSMTRQSVFNQNLSELEKIRGLGVVTNNLDDKPKSATFPVNYDSLFQSAQRNR